MYKKPFFIVVHYLVAKKCYSTFFSLSSLIKNTFHLWSARSLCHFVSLPLHEEMQFNLKKMRIINSNNSYVGTVSFCNYIRNKGKVTETGEFILFLLGTCGFSASIPCTLSSLANRMSFKWILAPLHSLFSSFLSGNSYLLVLQPATNLNASINTMHYANC